MAARLTPTDRRILRLAVPALGALAVEPLYVLVDTAIVGRLGTEELAGLALAATVLSFVVAGANFLTYGTTERVARRVGARIVAAPVLAVSAPFVVGALGGDGGVRDVAVEYLRIRVVGIPFVLVTLAAQGVLRGVSRYRTPLVILLVANAVNVVVELLLVFGLGWGIAGAAWSTVLDQIGAAVAFGATIGARVRPARVRHPDLAGMAPLMRAGRHLVLRVAAMLAVFGGATAIAARIDAATLAAHQIVMSVFLLLALTLDALAVPAQTIVAEELGRRGATAAAHVAERAVRLSVIGGAVLTLVIVVTAPLLPRLFTADGAVVDRATPALLLLGASMVPAAVAFAHDGVLIGAADYRFLGLAAVGYLVAVAPAGFAVVLTDAGIVGLWASLGGWMVLRAVVNHRRTARVLGGV